MQMTPVVAFCGIWGWSGWLFPTSKPSNLQLSSRQVAQAAPGRPAFRMHLRLEYFIAVVEVQFMLDIVEVESRARKSESAATTQL
jgi:hypothetical protein